MQLQHFEGYSSRVEIHLVVNGEKLRVAQVGPDSLMLGEDVRLPASTEATIVISVDGEEESHVVILPEGTKRQLEPVRFF